MLLHENEYDSESGTGLWKALDEAGSAKKHKPINLTEAVDCKINTKSTLRFTM